MKNSTSSCKTKSISSTAATATKNPQLIPNPTSSTAHILHPDKIDTGGRDDHGPSGGAGPVPPPRPTAPPYLASAASAASRHLSEFMTGNSNWYANPLDVWSRAGSSAAVGAAGGSGKSVQFAAGTEPYSENVRCQISRIASCAVATFKFTLLKGHRLHKSFKFPAVILIVHTT